MSIMYNATNGMVLSVLNQTDNINIGNNCIISSSSITYNAPIQLPSIIPSINMIGYAYSTRIPGSAYLPLNSSSVINIASIPLSSGIYLFNAYVYIRRNDTAGVNFSSNYSALQFNDISSNVIDTSGLYGGCFEQLTPSTTFKTFTTEILINNTSGMWYLNLVINTPNQCYIIAGYSSYTITRIS